jgi:hypothetical protein
MSGNQNRSISNKTIQQLNNSSIQQFNNITISPYAQTLSKNSLAKFASATS